MRIIKWTFGNALIEVVATDEDLWFSHKALSLLFGVTKQNISIHIFDLVASGLQRNERLLSVMQTEGDREVTRQIKHFPFEIAHAIALRSQRYEELNKLVELAKGEALLKPIYKISPIKERNFAALLIGALNGIKEIWPQHQIGPYIVDFFFPAYRLVIEYDESHHQRHGQKRHDQKRQEFIEKSIGATFIRVSEGFEIEGLNAVLRHLFANMR